MEKASTISTFFGFMHGEAIGVAQSPTLAASYLGVAANLLACENLPALSFTPAQPVPHPVKAAE